MVFKKKGKEGKEGKEGKKGEEGSNNNETKHNLEWINFPTYATCENLNKDTNYDTYIITRMKE